MKLTKLTLAAMASLVLFSGAFATVYHDGIEEIMEKGFKKGGVRHKLSTEVDKDKPNWTEVQKQAKELSTMCANLCKEKPAQGDAASWKKLTESLAKEAKTLNDAVGRKDQPSAKAAMGKINGSCKECHDIHRP